jgi:hypothetical protein
MQDIRRTTMTLIALACATLAAQAETLSVDCDGGETLTAALEAAVPGDVIEVAGYCTETVQVTTDRLTLEGGGVEGEPAVIDGGDAEEPVILISARGVVVRGFTLRRGLKGILGVDAASFDVEDTLTELNAEEGIDVDKSTANLRRVSARNNGAEGFEVLEGSKATLTDCSSLRNAVGMRVVSGGNVRFFGRNVFGENVGEGIATQVGSQLIGIFTELVLRGNGGDGLLLTDSGALFLAAQVTARDNSGSGIRVVEGSSFLAGRPGIPLAGATSLHRNGVDGITVGSNSSLVVTENGHLVSHRNGASGVSVHDSSTATLVDVSLRFNELAGLLADDSSVTLRESQLSDNATDLVLRFAARATFDDNVIVTASCESTVLTRGSFLCP